MNTISTLPQKTEDYSPMAEPSIETVVGILDSIRDPILVLDAGLKVVKANNSFYQTFKVDPTSTEGACIYDLGNRQWN